jgi:hypothetical protein
MWDKMTKDRQHIAKGEVEELVWPSPDAENPGINSSVLPFWRNFGAGSKRSLSRLCLRVKSEVQNLSYLFNLVIF